MSATMPDIKRLPAGSVTFGDSVRKQRGVWFTVTQIEVSGDYVCLWSKDARHWKNARRDTLIDVRKGQP